MTAPADLARALDTVWQVLVTAPWTTDPPQAERLLHTANARLHTLAAEVDPASWPRDVRTYLWRPADHDT